VTETGVFLYPFSSPDSRAIASPCPDRFPPIGPRVGACPVWRRSKLRGNRPRVRLRPMPTTVVEALRRQAKDCLRVAQTTSDPAVRNELLTAAACCMRRPLR
jgi:hypothetical protein